jgi:hypothetical protein
MNLRLPLKESNCPSELYLNRPGRPLLILFIQDLRRLYHANLPFHPPQIQARHVRRPLDLHPLPPSLFEL